MDYILWYIGRRSKVLFWETTKTNLKYNKTSNNFTIQEYFISSVLGTKCEVYYVNSQKIFYIKKLHQEEAIVKVYIYCSTKIESFYLRIIQDVPNVVLLIARISILF